MLLRDAAADYIKHARHALGLTNATCESYQAKIWYRLDKGKLYQLLRAYRDKKGTVAKAATNLGGKRQDEEKDAPATGNLGENDQPILAQNAKLI